LNLEERRARGYKIFTVIWLLATAVVLIDGFYRLYYVTEFKQHGIHTVGKITDTFTTEGDGTTSNWYTIKLNDSTHETTFKYLPQMPPYITKLSVGDIVPLLYLQSENEVRIDSFAELDGYYLENFALIPILLLVSYLVYKRKFKPE